MKAFVREKNKFDQKKETNYEKKRAGLCKFSENVENKTSQKPLKPLLELEKTLFGHILWPSLLIALFLLAVKTRLDKPHPFFLF